MKKLSIDNIERYARNLHVHNFSEKEQEMLLNSSVLVVGAGGLGSSLLSYLVASGVGRVGIVEFDVVSISNLQRQILYRENDLGKFKGEVAKQTLQKINSECDIVLYNSKFTDGNSVEVASGYDLIADCTDNYEVRYIIDRVARQLKIPFVYASAEQSGGQLATFDGSSLSYSELFPDSPLSDGKVIGVLSPMPGIIGSMQALEVIKQLTGCSDNLSGRLLIFNGVDYKTEVYEL